MIREIITPTERELTVELPEEYLNRPVEVLVFPVLDNATNDPNIPSQHDTLQQRTDILTRAKTPDIAQEINKNE